MKNRFTFLLSTVLGGIFLILILIMFVSMKRVGVSTSKKGEATGFAVVELFTSEGCSSCPAADKLVEKIQHEYGAQQVYLLAYHVDYWDRLGWKDPFDDAAFTKRQYEYASKMKLNSVYTPQIVVNGVKEFVGSNEATLRQTLTSSLSVKSAVEFSIKNVSKLNNKITLGYNLTGIEGDYSIKLAIVEKTAKSMVLRGENKGKELSHVQIVRAITSFKLKNTEKLSIDIPKGVSVSEVVAFVQNNDTGKIVAATKSGI